MEYFTKIVYIMNVCWSFVEQADIEGRPERLYRETGQHFLSAANRATRGLSVV